MLQTIRRLLIRPGCFWLERELPGGTRTHDNRAPWQGTQWNRIEHRLFSFFTQNWRGRPLVSYQAIVQLIAATTTDAGLKVKCEIDTNSYPEGVKIEDAEMEALNLHRHDFHGEWNYTIKTQTTSQR